MIWIHLILKLKAAASFVWQCLNIIRQLSEEWFFIEGLAVFCVSSYFIRFGSALHVRNFIETCFVFKPILSFKMNKMQLCQVSFNDNNGLKESGIS